MKIGSQEYILYLYRKQPLDKRIAYSKMRGWSMWTPYYYSAISGKLLFHRMEQS
jgi:hypothetical protein